MSLILNLFITMLVTPWGSAVMMSPMMFAAPGSHDSLRGLITGMVFLGYPLPIFLIAGLFGVNFWGFNSFKVAGAVAVVWVLAILFLGIPSALINLARGIANEGYSVVDNVAYYNARPIAGSDAATFTSFNTIEEFHLRYFALDKHHLYEFGRPVEGVDVNNLHLVERQGKDYWMNDHQVVHGTDIVKNANPATFQPFEENNWAHSETDGVYTLYYQHEPIADADFATFEPIDYWFARDKQQVYYRGEKAPVDLDPASLVVMENRLVRDHRNLYAFEDMNFTPFPNIDISTLEQVDSLFVRDKEQLFFHQDAHVERLEGIDPNHFNPLGRQYYRAGNRIFFTSYCDGLMELTSADANSFEVQPDDSDNSFDARDKQQTYRFGEIYEEEAQPGN